MQCLYNIIQIKHTTMIYTNSQTRSIIAGSALLMALVAMAFMPLFASAASYAYVDVAGTVRAVTADNWQAAISTAPNNFIF